MFHDKTTWKEGLGLILENHIKVIPATKRSLGEPVTKEQGPGVFNCWKEGVSHKKCMVSVFRW